MELLHRNLCALAINFSDAGFTPVLDLMIPCREKLDFFLDLLTPRQVMLVVLAPGIDVCRYRNTIRDPRDRFSLDLPPGSAMSFRGSRGLNRSVAASVPGLREGSAP